jgi:hypothetical protein
MNDLAGLGPAIHENGAGLRGVSWLPGPRPGKAIIQTWQADPLN